MMPATPNERADLSSDSDATDVSALATELAMLEGVAHQFDAIVAQILDAQRQIGTRRIMSEPGVTRDRIASSMTALDGALEKIEQNLRGQYDDFLSAHAAFKVSNLSLGELSDFVEVLRGDSIQRYFAKRRSLQHAARHYFQQMAQDMVKRAIGVPPKPP